jgi:hypothetical protein
VQLEVVQFFACNILKVCVPKAHAAGGRYRQKFETTSQPAKTVWTSLKTKPHTNVNLFKPFLHISKWQQQQNGQWE